MTSITTGWVAFTRKLEHEIAYTTHLQADDVLRTALKNNNEKTRLRSENGVLGCHKRPHKKKKDVQGYDDI